MKKLLVATTAAATFCGASAFAADMPVKAPAVAPPVFNWTGLYVGGDIGYLWGSTDYVLATNGFSEQTSPRGVLGGGHVGYNWQSSNWVAGFEGDFLGSSAKGSNVFGGGTLDVEKITWTSSARLRAGYTNGAYLLYATGGAAWADLDHRRPIFVPPTTGASATLFGWTVGAGLEALISTNWTARLEYRYTEYDRHNFPVPSIASGSDLLEKVRTQQVLLGVSYKFGDPWGKSPVVAKY
jgi:outer membrane immunogenic protein